MLTRALMAVVVFFTATTAMGQTAHKPGFYLGLEGGALFMQDSKSGFGRFTSADLSYERGLTAGATAGYDFGRFFRAEFEFNYKKANIDRLQTNFRGRAYTSKNSGSIRSLNYMFNAYLQYPLSDYVVPYLGVGVGMADVKMDKICIFNCKGGSSSQHLLAYQIIAGMGVNISENVTLAMDYRYSTTNKGRFETNLCCHPDLKTSISSHNVMVGLRYKF